MPAVEEFGTVELRLSSPDLAFLLPLVKGSQSLPVDTKVLQSLSPTTTEGTYRAQVGAFAGRLSLPSGTVVDFVPRIAGLDVLEIIRVAQRHPARLDFHTVGASKLPFLLDMLAATLCFELESIAGTGLHKAYQTNTHYAPPYPGVPDFAAHLRVWSGRPDRLVTRSRRLTVDNLPNRELASALTLLDKMQIADVLQPRVARLKPVFVQVRHQRSPGVVARLETLGAPRSYLNALSAARILLEGSSIAPVGDSINGAAVLYSMPRIWEEYVNIRLRESFGSRIDTSHSFRLSSAGHTATADALLRDDAGAVRAVIDAKYRRPDSAPSTDEIFQIVTYCERLGSTDGVLIYPGSVKPRSLTVGHKRVHIAGMLPSVDFAWPTEC